jgi:hypothetical protein
MVPSPHVCQLTFPQCMRLSTYIRLALKNPGGTYSVVQIIQVWALPFMSLLHPVS